MKVLEDFTTKVLACMRCVYGVGSLAPILEDEWLGDEESLGAKDYIQSLLRSEIKKAYMSGFVNGGVYTFSSMQELADKNDLEFSDDDAKIGAERGFLEWESGR